MQQAVNAWMQQRRFRRRCELAHQVEKSTLVVPTELSDSDRAYGRDLGIDPARIVHFPSSALLQVVPTILVIDRSGVIRLAQSGLPPLLSGPQLATKILGVMPGV